jgi:hypothetical protein
MVQQPEKFLILIALIPGKISRELQSLTLRPNRRSSVQGPGSVSTCNQSGVVTRPGRCV